MASQFDANKIATYLAPLSNDLSKLYHWDISEKSINSLIELGVWSDVEKAEITALKGKSCYEKGIVIKAIVSKKLNALYPIQKAAFKQLSLWIIRDWGGIKGSKKVPQIDDYRNPDTFPFKRIASSSKVGAFMQPNECIIYDSRVAYSLNWIILSENAGEQFFPIPDGRNSKMNAFDVNVFIRQKYIENYRQNDVDKLSDRRYIHNKDKALYIDEDKAYTTLNQLIKDVLHILWQGGKSKSIYLTEMLLFAIADREIVADITQRLSLKIEPSNSR